MDEINLRIASLRGSQEEVGLDEEGLPGDPMEQFSRWMKDSIAAGIELPTAMTLATVGSDGRPSARMVLLKHVDPRGFAFYTNYGSRKARDLAAHPHAALVLYWNELHRQVRIEGRVSRLSDEESDAYWSSRPLDSRLGAYASPQSRVIDSRRELERRLEEVRERFGDHLPRPDFWGGYRVEPNMIEFWQGRAGRLHDRLVYLRDGPGWNVERLAP